MPSATAQARWRRFAPFLLAPVVLILILWGLILTIGPAPFRSSLERHLSRAWGRPVRIGAMEEVHANLLHLTLSITDIRVGQPDWANGRDLLRIPHATVRLPLLPLLLGQARLRSVELDHPVVTLIRLDGARASWKGLPAAADGGGLEQLRIRDGRIILDDRKRDHHLTGSFSADDAGFRLAATGTLAAAPARMTLTGPAITRASAWPFRFDYRSHIANFALAGTADHPLDLGHFSAGVQAWGTDLADLDRLVEAGLPGTQPVRLTATVRHDKPDWTLRNLRGRIGRSDLSLRLDIHKANGRTHLDGDLSSTGFDFNDLASDAGRARAAAKRRALGSRLIPDTQIHLEHLARTDGTLRFNIHRLLGSDTFRTLSGTLTLDHRLLTADPLSLGLASGSIAGRASVDHRQGAPLLALDLRLRGARLERLLTHDDVATGALAAHVHLSGRGRTVREAVGASSGTLALVAQDGTIGRRAALFLGSDLGRALFEGQDERTDLRCLIARFDVTGGQARPDPLVIDTGVARIDGAGGIDLRDERIALSLTGHPKLDHALSLSGAIRVDGPLAKPAITPPTISKTVGTAFRLLGKLITGDSEPPAAPADCTDLAARALR